MIDQTSLVEDVLLADKSVLPDSEIHHLTSVADVDKWFATDAETASKWLIEEKPTIISHFGIWIGQPH